MATPSIDQVGIFDLNHEEYLANFLRDCESREWSKFIVAYAGKNRNAKDTLSKHAITFQGLIKSSGRAQEIDRIKKHEDSLVQTAKKAHNRKGYETYLNETHLFTLPAAELIERESSDWQSIQRIGPKSYNYSAERKVSDFLSEWKNSEFRPAAEERLKAIRKAIQEAEASRLRALEDDAWAKATTISSVEAYLSSWPKGRYIAAANDLLRSLWQEQKDQEDKAAYFAAKSLDELRAYLKDWPSGSYRLQAEERIAQQIKEEFERRDLQAWHACQHLDDFMAYLANWPDGKFRDLAKIACDEMKAERRAAQELAWRDIRFGNRNDYGRFLELFPDAEQATFARERIKAFAMKDRIWAMQDRYFESARPKPLSMSLVRTSENEDQLIDGISDLFELNTGSEFSRPWVETLDLQSLRFRSFAIGRCLSPFLWAVLRLEEIVERSAEHERFGIFSMFVLVSSWVASYVMLSEVFSELWSAYGPGFWFLGAFVLLPVACFLGVIALFYALHIILVFFPLLVRASYEALLMRFSDKTCILFRRDVEKLDRLMKERKS